MIRLKDITLPFDHTEDALAGGILGRLGIPGNQLLNFTIVHKSIDARRKNHIVAVYTVGMRLYKAPLLKDCTPPVKVQATPAE